MLSSALKLRRLSLFFRINQCLFCYFKRIFIDQTRAYNVLVETREVDEQENVDYIEQHKKHYIDAEADACPLMRLQWLPCYTSITSTNSID